MMQSAGDPPGAAGSALVRNRLFTGADPEVVRRCQRLFKKETFRRNDQPFSQGDPSESVYLIASGFVRFSYLLYDGREVSVALTGPGDLIGEEALLGVRRRPFTATAVEACTVFRARGDRLAALFQTNATLAINLACHMSERCEEVGLALEDVAQGRVRERLLRALRRMATQCGERSSGGQRLAVKLTHHEIATFVGSTRETVTVALAELIQAGVISRSLGSFTISMPS